MSDRPDQNEAQDYAEELHTIACSPAFQAMLQKKDKDADAPPAPPRKALLSAAGLRRPEKKPDESILSPDELSILLNGE